MLSLSSSQNQFAHVAPIACVAGPPRAYAFSSHIYAKKPRVFLRPLDIRMLAARSEGFGINLAKLGRKIQGGLPLVGLISRLTAPEGGFDELTYPEFCRSWLERGSDKLNFAVGDLEALHKRRASRRPIFFLAWMVQRGLGILPARYIVVAARRLNASLDIELEMNRFEQQLAEEKQKTPLLKATLASNTEMATVLIDALSSCCLGLRDGQPIGTADWALLKDIVSVFFDDVDDAELDKLAAARIERKYD